MMKHIFNAKMIRSLMIILLLFIFSTAVLFPFVSNVYILFAVIIVQFIVLLVMLIHFYSKHVKPIEKASETMDRLLEGNYRSRVHHEMTGSIGELNQKINALARSLSKLTTLEQIRAEQLSTVVEHAESALALIDDKGYIHLVNEQFSSMFGKEQYIGYLYYEKIKHDQINGIIQETFLHERRLKKVISFLNYDETLYLEIIAAPIFNERNMLNGIVLVIFDVTDLKRVDLIRRDFVANVSHELRTPITSIQGFAETLLDGAGKDAQTRDDFLKIIYNESKRIHLLVDDLLVLSKLENEQFHLTFSEINMKALIAELVTMMKRQAAEKEITILYDVENMSAFHADVEKIRQVLLNLLANAISYTPEKGTIKITGNVQQDIVCFTIKDTGIGIAHEHLPRLFERFYRIDKDRSRETGGTGLGLAIAKHIVELHHGEIEVKSELGIGTTFTFYIPFIEK